MKSNYMHAEELSHEKLVKSFKKLKKRTIIEMLINANDLLNQLSGGANFYNYDHPDNQPCLHESIPEGHTHLVVCNCPNCRVTY